MQYNYLSRTKFQPISNGSYCESSVRAAISIFCGWLQKYLSPYGKVYSHVIRCSFRQKYRPFAPHCLVRQVAMSGLLFPGREEELGIRKISIGISFITRRSWEAWIAK
jgi:hypothetical protein